MIKAVYKNKSNGLAFVGGIDEHVTEQKAHQGLGECECIYIIEDDKLTQKDLIGIKYFYAKYYNSFARYFNGWGCSYEY